ncbi:MAG: aldehyde ferredoxin oxidoreductase family protein [bacterium]|nr:aldehyde ferredoxin oxidoreductase family protein [bacterium]
MYGWTGKILEIDCSKKTTTVIEPGLDIYKKYIGGKGLAGYYLRPLVRESWNSPNMPLLFFTGPLVDTPSPTSGRMTIMSRSPISGTVGDTSVGGKLGPQIKRAGYDGIILRGRSRDLCGIQIQDSTVEFIDAGHLAGKDVSSTMEQLPGEGSLAMIGPAAENGVLFAGIAIDGHFLSGRSGLGLVMAAKNVKFIRVQGSQKTNCFNTDEVKKAREEIFRLAAASPILKGELGISEYGTGALYDLMDSRRMMPTDNFRKTHFPHAGTMNAAEYKKRYNTKKAGCQGCHIQCKKKGKENSIIPEFETMSHFSALLSNTNTDTVVEANRICNELGMDTISAAVTLACYAEINDRRLEPEDILRLLNDIGYSKGEGAELKLGSYRYAESKGKPELSMSVKKLELAAYDPRGAYGMALAFTTSTRGGCHLRAYPISHEILRKPAATDRFTLSGKARIIKISEDINAVVDSLVACRFIFFAASLEEYARAFTGVTGVEITSLDLQKAGERIYYNERIMNAENGFTKKDDDLPERFFTEPGSSGDGITIPPINREEFLQARGNYYKVRGLDEDGMPTPEKCEELGL